MVQGGRRDSLALEPLSCHRIDVTAKHLDRDRALEPPVASAIHLPRAPFADQGFDSVGSDVGAGRDGRGELRATLYESRRTALDSSKFWGRSPGASSLHMNVPGVQITGRALIVPIVIVSWT
jgi:hypothetical protein